MASPPKRMRAVQYSKFGGGASALEHVEVPVPGPAKDQVLVKVEAASVNPIDRKGIQKGIDIAGEVSVGVTSFAIGDKVSCWTGVESGGALAEYAVAPIKTTAKRRGNVSALDGASLGVAGQSAFESVRDCGVILDGSSKDKNLFITAASGSVGTSAVQVQAVCIQLNWESFSSQSPQVCTSAGDTTR